MDPAAPKRESKRPRGAALSQNGRPLGPRALKTRERLLDVTAELLEERGVLDLSVVDIARRADTSPGTFYHYFQDVQEAVLMLAERAGNDMPAVVELIDGPWEGSDGLDRARAIVARFIAHWDTHHAVLSLRNLAADRGDVRFQQVRRTTLRPIVDHFTAKIRGAQQAGRVPTRVHAGVAAAGILALLERLSAHKQVLRRLEASPEDLVETCARMIHQTVTGGAAEQP